MITTWLDVGCLEGTNQFFTFPVFLAGLCEQYIHTDYVYITDFDYFFPILRREKADFFYFNVL